MNIEFLNLLNKNLYKSEKTIQNNFSDLYNDILKETSFLSIEDQNWSMRKYCYRNNIKEYPKCVVCGNKCKIRFKTCCNECKKIYCKSDECINLKIQKAKEKHGEDCYKRKLSNFDILKKNDINLYNDVFDKTKWMREDTSYSERMYCYHNNIKEYPKCVVCGNNVKFIQGHGYTKTCCNECNSIHSSQTRSNFSEEKKKDIRERTSQTRSNFSEEKKKDIRERTSQTKLNFSEEKKKDILNKMKHTCIERYGVDNIFKNKEYIKECVKNKYGVDNIFKKKEYIKQKLKEKYGVTNSTYIDKPKFVIDILNNENKFKDMIKYNDLKSVNDIMNYLNVSDFCVLQHLKKYNIQGLINRNVSHYEDDITEWLKSFNINVINNKKMLNGKEIDIFLPDYNIGIEFNGNYWHCDELLDKKYHQQKSLTAKNKVIFIYHIFEYEWKKDE